MATDAMTIDASSECDFDSVRDTYISAVNAAVAAGRDDLAIELAVEYEMEFPARAVSAA